MYVDVIRQAQVWLNCILAGGGLGVAYDVLRAVRRTIRWRWLAFLLDLLFWIGVIFLLFSMALAGERGEVRLYIGASFLLGGGVYLLTLSRLVLPLMVKILGLLAKICHWIMLPARKGLSAAKKSLQKAKKRLPKLVEMV